VFLYLKINETEPQLPEGVEDWSTSAEIQFDMEGSDFTALPQFEAAPVEEAPPEFASAPENTISGNPASAFAPTPVDASPSYAATPASGTTMFSQPVDTTEVQSLPELPPLPALPSTETTAAAPTSPLGGAAPEINQALPATAPVAAPQAAVTPTPITSPTAQAQSSLFSATRLHVQAALDRGEFSQALLLLSDWYGDPSLSPSETQEINGLLSQLAGSVIYSTEHRLEPPYLVQAGERLETIAEKYEIPWQLLAKINGITSADQLTPGQELKVVRGPFSALIDLSQRTMTLMLDRRYAGKFALNFDPGVNVEEGHWEVNQKLLTPANASLTGAGGASEERSLTIASIEQGVSQVAILRGATSSNPVTEPAGRVLRMNSADAEDVFDILSLGSKVVIRR
jgi:LysM repeat protein